jgi:hypothetical protein
MQSAQSSSFPSPRSWSRGLFCVATLALAACSQFGSGERVGEQNRELSGVQPLAFDLPPLVSSESVALGASNSLNLGDRTLVTGVNGSLTSISAMGSGGTTLNPDAKVGNLYSRGPISLRDRAQVRGSIFTASSISRGNNTSVLGLTFPGFVFDPPGHFAWTVDVPAPNTTDVRLEPDQHRTLSPGRYRTVSIKSRSDITLGAGNYFIDSLDVLEPQAIIKVDTSAGKVKLYVTSSLTFRGALQNVGDTSKSDLLIVMLGTGTVFLEQPYRGFLIAPSATLQFRQTSTAHSGAFFAQRIVSDAGALFQHRPFNFKDFFPSDDLVITPQEIPPREVGIPSEPPDDIVTDLGLPPGQRACDPGLVLDSELDGIQSDTTIRYRDQAGTPGGCVVDYQECQDDETGAENPTEAELNRQPSLNSLCPGNTDSLPCGVDASTISWDEFGECQTDADCVLFGKVCAKVCLKPNCTGSEDCIDPLCGQGSVLRCAKQSTSCAAQPTEGPCEVLRECAEPDASGDSDPHNHTLTGQPPSNIDDPPADTPPPSSVGPSRPSSYENQDDICNNGTPAQLGPPLQPEPEDRDMIAGNDKWGIIAQPTMQFSGDVSPKPLGGQAGINAKGEAGLKIAVRLWGKDYTVFEANGKAEFAACKAQLSRSLILVGQDIDPGSGSSDQDSNDRSTDCAPLLDAMSSRLANLKTAQSKAIDVKKFSDCLGPVTASNAAQWDSFCTGALNALGQLPASSFEGFTFPTSCSGSGAGPAMAAAWQNVYGHLRDKGVSGIANLSSIRKAVYDKLGGSPLQFLDIDQAFTGFKFDFTYPVGPVTVSIDIELDGGCGISGDLSYAAEAPPNTKLEAQASIRPRFDSTVVVFAGIGLGPVVVGVEGELLLLAVQTPLQAGVTLKQSAVTDTRTPFYAGLSSTAKYAFEEPSNAPSGFIPFGPTLYDWDAEWTYGAGVHLESLSGQIDLAAKIKLLFFTKKWKKKLARWDALFTLDKAFTGTLATEGDKTIVVPKGDKPGLGTFYEQVPFVDPQFVKTFKFSNPQSSCPPPSLGPCMIVK